MIHKAPIMEVNVMTSERMMEESTKVLKGWT